MVGRGSRRASAVFVFGLAASAAVLFAVAATRSQAGGQLLERMAAGVRGGVRSLTGQGVRDADRALASRGGAVIGAKSPLALAREFDARSRDARLVRLKAHEFDPQADALVPATLPELLAPRVMILPDAAASAGAQAHEYWIVQTEEDDPAFREQIESIGVHVQGWVPNSSWLVKLLPGQVQQLEALPDVRWVGPFVAAYKVTPGLSEMVENVSSTDELPIDDKGRVRIAVNFHYGTDVTKYLQVLSSLAGVEILQTEVDSHWVLLGVAPLQLRETVISLATLLDTYVIDVQTIPVPDNDNCVWKIQTNIDRVTDYATSARLFALGIAGQGMIGAVGDSGLENDLCQFRYRPTLADTTWRLGPDDGQPLPQETGPYTAVPPPIRNRERKVVAYYLMDAATAYDEIITAPPELASHEHGTAVAGTMLGDANDVLAGRPLIRNTGLAQNVAPYTASSPWTFGQLLRDDLAPFVDDPTTNQPAFPVDFGATVQHHARRDGMAPAAQLVFFDLGSAAGLVGLGSPSGMPRRADDTGASVFNASYSFGVCDPATCYSGMSAQGDAVLYARRALVGFVSASNDADQGPAATIGAGYGNGLNWITVGAAERADSGSQTPTGRPRGDDIASYSSKGPKVGGLLAPEIIAPGTMFTAYDLTADPEDGTNSGNGGCGPSPAQIPEVNGTSFASPAAAGAGLLIQQYFLDGWYPSGEKTPENALRPTNALVRALLVNSTRNMQGGRTDDLGTDNVRADRPNFGQGWGMISLDDSLHFTGDPRLGVKTDGETERARLLVLNDTPNGYSGAGGTALTAEPGGKQRLDLIPQQKPTIRTGTQSYFLNVVKTDFDGDGADDDAGNEFRVTLAWMNPEADVGAAFYTPNDLDLELISPSGIVYRPSPISGVWQGGYTEPATQQTPQALNAPFTDYNDRDRLNTVENVFIAPADLEPGPWTIKVVGYSVRGGPSGGYNDGRPNFISGDAASVDLGTDGVADGEAYDLVRPQDQGYALVVTGNFTTDQGSVSLNRSFFDCAGDDLVITLNDQNGAVPRDTCDPGSGALDPEVTVTVTTTTPSLAFPIDREIVVMDDGGDGPPTYTSPSLPVIVTQDPAAVVHGDGQVQVYPDETIVATYIDAEPCGGRAYAQASVGCTPSVEDSGFGIEDGCDRAVPGDVTTPLRPDGFLDAGELARYTVFFLNAGGDDLHEPFISLTPDPTDPVSRFVHVLDSPQRAGLAPPGRRSDVTFLVQLDRRCSADCDPASPGLDGIPPRYQLEFEVGVTSPLDNLLFPDTFIQTQVLEADIESYRYNTRDPNANLFGLNRIEQLVPGATEGSSNPADYVRHSPMWFDPDADCDAGAPVVPCSSVCNVHPSVAPPACFTAGVRVNNPRNPWDFDDSDDAFHAAAHDGDTPIGPGQTYEIWFWKNAPNGGGCGWEDELHRQLASLPAGDPDKFATPWGIWHTGPINPTNPGIFPGPWADNQGVPFYDPPDGDRNPSYHTIMRDWTADAGAPANNVNGQWCTTYLSNATIGDYYRSFLIPPRLYKVHRSSADFKVHFEELRFYSRMDGHTIDGDNVAVAGWFVNNTPVDPISLTPETWSWSQWQYGTLIFTDGVNNDWSEDDSFLSVGLSSPNEDFPDLNYEEIYGPAEDSWNFAFSWGQMHFNDKVSKGQYGWGLDDVQFIWTESREVDDGSDCGTPTAQPPTVFFSETRYNACEGDLEITVIDCDQVLDEIAVAVSSAAEDVEIAYLERVADPAVQPCGYKFVGKIRFTTDPAKDAVGILLASAGSIDIGNGADVVTVEYDPQEADPDLGQSDPFEIGDWQDLDLNGLNDDTDGDGIPDAEDDPTGARERGDSSVINCTSGHLYYIRHRLQEHASVLGDGDRFADHGEKQWLSVELLQRLGVDLTDVKVTISTTDPTVCIEKDTVLMDVLSSGVRTETPINPTAAIERQGFLFSVPLAVRTTDLANPATVTFRVDVEGIRADNLNAFSTRGEGFNTFLPQEARLLLDIDETTVPTTPNYDDNDLTAVPPRSGRDQTKGEWREGFENPDGVVGYDHPWIPNLLPGPHVATLDALRDTRFDVNLNGGFCPECDFQSECRVPTDCTHQFTTDAGAGIPYLLPTNWDFTTDWAKEIPAQYGFLGVRAMKFGRVGDGPDVLDQHYDKGQFTSLELPPLRIADRFPAGEAPELKFWHIADFWTPFFTNGLFTPVGAGVVEISGSAKGLPRNDRYTQATLDATYPTSSFRRMYPFENSYTTETDVLNACGTFFCRYKHPVMSDTGSFTVSPTVAGDPRGGSTTGTWTETIVDLSDYRGQEVVLRFTVAVIQDLDIQNGQFGWVVDDIRVFGVSPAMGLALQRANTIVVDPCGLEAEFVSTSADCAGEAVQFLDAHSGLGAFAPPVPPDPARPYDISYEWIIGSLRIGPGDAGQPVVGQTGVRGTHDNPQVNLTTALGSGPGIYPATLILYQNGTEMSRVTHDVVYKDAPVALVSRIGSGPFAGGATRFTASVAFDTAIDASRSLTYVWDFGDGTAPVTSGADVSHVFEAAGSYTVTVTVTDEDGCSSADTLSVTVIAGPRFETPTWAFARDCNAGSAAQGAGDGNGDLNEYIQLNVGFTNAGAAATGVTGYLSSADPAVEVTQGVAYWASIAPGPAPPRAFTFIRRLVPGESTSCIIVPLTLTVVSDSGSIVQVLELAYPLGGANKVSWQGVAGAPPQQGGTMGQEVTFTFTPPITGCLDSFRLRMTVETFNLATSGLMSVQLQSPEFEAFDVKFADGTGGTGHLWTVDFQFSPDNAPPAAAGLIPSTSGLVDDAAMTLPQSTADGLIGGMTGDALSVAGQTWKIVVRDTHALQDPAGTFRATIQAFDLEGSSPVDLDTGVEPTCTQYLACFPSAPPVFEPAQVSCPDLLTWRAALDASTCGGFEDVDYDLYAFSTAGAAMPVTFLDPATQSCADCPPAQACAFTRAPGQTFWRVCDVETIRWTVVAVDGTTGATTPTASTDIAYRTATRSCVALPGLPRFGIVKTAAGGTPTYTVWLVNPSGAADPVWDLLKPSPGATSHRLLRGTFPTGARGLQVLGERDPSDPYDHPDGAGGVTCSFVGTASDQSAVIDPGGGSYYFLVAGVNAAGCSGLGYQGTPGAALGSLECAVPRPAGGDTCAGGGCSAGILAPGDCP